MQIVGSVRRAPVVAYLISAFTVCIVAVGALIALTSASSFKRERSRAAIELQAVARSDADATAQTFTESIGWMQQFTGQPALTSLDPAQCQAGMSPLGSLMTTPGMLGDLEVLRPDGSVVCGIHSRAGGPSVPRGDWFDRVLTSKQPVDGGYILYPGTNEPAVIMALPIAATAGRTGVLAMMWSTSQWTTTSGTGTPKPRGVFTVQLDRARKIVVQASKGAPVKPGAVTEAWMTRGIGSGVKTVRDSDGVVRIYREVSASSGMHVLAGIPERAALVEAKAELRRNVFVGLGVILLVGALGGILIRRLARPIVNLRRTIAAASHDSSARAVVEGPAEVAALAEVFNDTIDERRGLELQLSHQALHDPLTGLPNRALLDDRLNVALAQHRRVGETNLAVLFLDLDRFKVINDSYGHERGDNVLVAIAHRLASALRPGDTVARFGGDEFVVLADDITSEREAMEIAERLKEVVEEPLELDGAESHIAVTIGIAIAGPRMTAGDLLRDADAAMYRGKERSRGSIEIFDEALGARARARADTEAAMRRGIRRQEFVVRYQPEIAVSSGKMTGVEALLRWDRPKHGLLEPADFIAVAEETGMIVELGDFVLTQTCRQLVDWNSLGLDLTASVNLSPRQLTDPMLPKRVKAILDETGASPDQLILEMTETALVEDDPRTMAILNSLKQLGVRLALDDFGTGYASLSYLRHFPVDVVKVDRSFIGDIGQRAGGAAIVAAVLVLGESLGLTTVAEGVETTSQLGALQRMGCAHMQGYLLSRPVEADEIPPLADHDLRPTSQPKARPKAS